MLYLLETDTCFGLACALDDVQGYQNIYQLKKRPVEKLIAIMVPDFEWLAQHTSLTHTQIHFLKNYQKPFSVLTNSELLQKKFEELGIFNRERYQQFLLRVAHTVAQQELISQLWPLFLTSANLSWDTEVYKKLELESIFAAGLKWGQVVFYKIHRDLPKTSPSEIFAFKDESLEQVIFRYSV